MKDEVRLKPDTTEIKNKRPAQGAGLFNSQRERTVYRSCSVVDVAHTYMTVQARKIETMRPVAAVVEEIMRLLSRSGVCSDV